MIVKYLTLTKYPTLPTAIALLIYVNVFTQSTFFNSSHNSNPGNSAVRQWVSVSSIRPANANDYCHWPYLIRRTNADATATVTFVTQGSIDYVQHLLQLLTYWTGEL
jgi:hypothetical protein